MEPVGWALALVVGSVAAGPSLLVWFWACGLDDLRGREVAESQGVTP
jgi:hypothetical protein